MSLALTLSEVESQLGDDPDAAAALLASARDELDQALEELRELARTIHPAVFRERGLGPALEALVAGVVGERPLASEGVRDGR